MNHRVAIRTHRHEVARWIDHVFAVQIAHGNQMLHKDKTFPELPIHKLKIESADHAIKPVVTNAGISRLPVPLDCVHADLLAGPLRIPLRCLAEVAITRQT